MNKKIISLLCLTVSTGLLSDIAVPNHAATIQQAIQYGIKNLLTQKKTKSRSKYHYAFTDKNVLFNGMKEFKKINITAENNSVTIYMQENEETNQDVTLIGLPSGIPSVNLYPENNNGIFIEVLTDTEFRRLPNHNLRVTKKNMTDSEDGFVEWGIFNNKRVLFAPIGYKSPAIQLPEDATTHLIEEGAYVDTDLALNGICLINGIVYVIADLQDVTIHLNEATWLMNANDFATCALVLLANEGLKITIQVDENMEWRSHLNAPFYVVQAGPGKVEVKIVANENNN
ncbi:hypothetical protein EKK58_03330 [Candidatus Dependentiae bacterium]|nr:MAG: hypothetical protein EKK58_03330 [Candidatus Dependentiae bacterium]